MKKWNCTHCDSENTKLYKTVNQENKAIRYYRCEDCKKHFHTTELRDEDIHLLKEIERIGKKYRK